MGGWWPGLGAAPGGPRDSGGWLPVRMLPDQVINAKLVMFVYRENRKLDALAFRFEVFAIRPPIALIHRDFDNCFCGRVKL